VLHKLPIGLAGIAFTLLLLAGCGGDVFEPGFRDDLPIPMRDGVTLIGDAYLPGPGQYPAIVEITPMDAATMESIFETNPGTGAITVM